ncbi:DNA translocase FtsK [Pseudomonas sp. B15(2017)]|uniref:DNA translocase FtsK n=1 Tax=Pseudomonas sp. B15(2017) TaxID=1981744 RepID=UPI000A1EBDB0|nr:DNA translocase FtsK [Pseudomonas sp. B15(2017)]
MKMEHKAIIERAKLAGIEPSDLAHELLVHDLVEAGLFELKNLHSPYSKLNEGQQQEVIERLTEAAEKAAHNAIGIIASRGATTIELIMKEVKFNSKQLTLTSIVDAKNPNRHDLIDSAGHICLLVMAPDDYNEGLDFIRPDRDQPDLPLHVSEMTGNLFEGKATGPDEPDGFEHTTGEVEDGLYSQAVAFVLESRRATISAVQRKLKIGYNRAAELMNKMENLGVVSPMDHTGAREVMLNPRGEEKISLADADDQTGSKDPLYTEAVEQLIAYGRLGAAAIAGTLSITNERAALMLNAMVESGAAVAVDGGNVFEIKGGDVGGGVDASFKEFGDFTYDDAKQLIVLKAQTKPFKAHWVQSRLAIDSDKVSSLLLRLLDDQVVAVEAEGESALEHSYKVVATLYQVV